MLTFGIVTTCLVGITIFYSLSKKVDLLEMLGCSFLLGVGTQSFLMFLFNLLKIDLNINLILISDYLIIAMLVTFLVVRKKLNMKATFKEQILSCKIGSSNLIWLSSLVLVTVILYVMSKKSLFWPTFAFDALTSFDLLAKGIAREGKIINSLVVEGTMGFGAAYPPLYSLSLAYSYMLGYASSKIIPVLFFISFILSFYAILRRLTNPTNAIFFTFFAIITPDFLGQSAINITSVPQAIFAALSVVSIIAWHKLKEIRYFYLSALFMGFNCFIRSESIVYLFPTLLFLGYVIIYQQKRYIQFFIYVAISTVPFLLWQLFLLINMNIMGQYIQVEIIKYPNIDFKKISYILGLASKLIVNTSYYGVTFYLFILAILLNVFNIKKKKDNLWILGIICFTFFGYLALLNQFEYKNGYEELLAIMKYSAKRFFFGIVLLMWFYISSNLLTKNLFKKMEKRLNI